MGDNGAEDLISELPDELLLHIFSFLDEMALVRSSVLSTRWRYLWTFIPFPTEMKKSRLFYLGFIDFHNQWKLFGDQWATRGVNPKPKITSYFLSCLLFFLLDFKSFACMNIVLTLIHMVFIYLDGHDSHYFVSIGEVRFKRLQEVNSMFRSLINSISTNCPRMKAMLPINYQLQHELTNSSVLFGMWVIMIISCSLTILNWKLDTTGRAYDFLLQSSLITKTVNIDVLMITFMIIFMIFSCRLPE